MGWPKGVPRPKQFSKTVSEAMKDYYKTHSHPRLGKRHSEETKKRWSKIRKGVKQSPDFVKRRTEGIKRYWENEENRKRASETKKEWFSPTGGGNLLRGRACRAKYLKYPIPQEVLVMGQLREKRIRYVHQKVIAKRYVVDIYVPCYNAVIECDRRFRKGPAGKRDAGLLTEVRAVVHILYKEIEADPKAATERALRCLRP